MIAKLQRLLEEYQDALKKAEDYKKTASKQGKEIIETRMELLRQIISDLKRILEGA